VDAGFDALRSKVSGQMSGKKSGGSSSDSKKVSCFGVLVQLVLDLITLDAFPRVAT
jgi:hypothetical protein